MAAATGTTPAGVAGLRDAPEKKGQECTSQHLACPHLYHYNWLSVDYVKKSTVSFFHVLTN